jgi:hypothetical protein
LPAAALITSLYGLDLAPPAFKLMGLRRFPDHEQA